MSFFSGLFHKKQTEKSIVVIDIGADSVAGAYVRYAEGGLPAILYARRLPIGIRTGEPHARAMLRALGILGEILVREGAPALLRASGSGSVDAVLTSVDAPWQTTSIRTEHFEQRTPFTFSRSLVAAALERTSGVPPGKLLADESIIGTTLNGYETREPYGKKTTRASVVILTSLIDERVTSTIHSIIRGLYHTENISSIAGSSLRYQAMRIAFPHERDALILDATGPMLILELVRRDLLVDVVEIQGHTIGTGAWLKRVKHELAELAGRFPLPRTIFLLAREPEISSLREKLDAADLGSLWLSDNPPKIVSVLGSHLAGFVRQTATLPDLSLLLMALFYQHRASGGEVKR